MSCFRWEALFPKPKGSKDKTASQPEQDDYMGTKFVYGLDEKNFTPFLKSKDLALVMFYQHNCKKCDFSKKHFKKASETTERANHAFAAVDCDKVPELCYDQDVPFLPYFKLFTRGRFIGFNDEYKLFTDENMKKWVEIIHIFDAKGIRIKPTK